MNAKPAPMLARGIAVVALCWSLVVAADSESALSALVVTAIHGDVAAERDGQHHALRADDIIDERDVLQLDDDGHLALRLASGGVLELGPGAELSIEKLPGSGRRGARRNIFSLTRGYLRVAWAPPDAQTSLVLYFSGQRATLGAGEYFFESGNDGAQVCVASGQLMVLPIAGSRAHTLAATACYRLLQGAEPESIRRDVAAWSSMRRNFSLSAPSSPEAELAASDPSARGAAAANPMTANANAAPADAAAASAAIARASAPPPPAGSVQTQSAPATQSAPTVAMPSGGWAINIASYPEVPPAEKQVAELKAGGYNAVLQPAQIGGRQWYRVQVRGFDSSAAASAQMQALKTKSGYANLWIVRAP